LAPFSWHYFFIIYSVGASLNIMLILGNHVYLWQFGDDSLSPPELCLIRMAHIITLLCTEYFTLVWTAHHETWSSFIGDLIQESWWMKRCWSRFFSEFL
jgi:hypothetical protein